MTDVLLHRADAEHIHAVLTQALQQNEARDQMNAAIHQAEVRWSSLTVDLQRAVGLLSQVIK